MFSKKLLLALALASAASAVPANGRRNDCDTAYNSCVAAGTPEVVCSCQRIECYGEDDERERDYCYSATASLAQPTTTAAVVSRDGDCEGTYKSCVAAGTPDIVCSCRLTECFGEDDAREREYCSSATATLALSTTLAQRTAAPVSPCQANYQACVADDIPDVVCSCRLTECLGEDDGRERDWCSSKTASLGPFPTVTAIPGGCNPAHPGSCPSSYFTYPTITATATPTAA